MSEESSSFCAILRFREPTQRAPMALLGNAIFAFFGDFSDFRNT
jgi:hypothetical protein